MKINNKQIPNLKAIAEITLSAILLKNYIEKDFNNTENLIKGFFKKNLPLIFKIKSYGIYQEIIDIEWNKFQYVFLKSLKNLDDKNILNRAKLDASLLINMPTQILLSTNNFYTKKSVFKSDNDDNDYLLGLILLLPNIRLKDKNNAIYDNKKIIGLKEKDLDGLSVANTGAKKTFKKYAKEIEDNKDKLEALKLIDNAYNDEVLGLNKLSAVGKKILFNDVWQSSFLSTSRESHKLASGSKRNSNGYFIVGGERFRYCGDWSNASIGNVINCRCYLINNY